MPRNIQRGDTIEVEVDGDVVLTGTVETVHTEWGRHGYTVIDDDGDDQTVWDAADMNITKVRPTAELAREAQERLQSLEEHVGQHLGTDSARDVQEIRDALREIKRQASV